MKRALILGCSHAAGSKISNDPMTDAENSFASQLAKQQGYKPTNLAIPGGSNEAMVRLFIQYAKNYNAVIAVWTGSERTEVWDDDHGWLQMSGGEVVGHSKYKDYARHWVINEVGSTPGNARKLRCVLSLNMLAQAWNIPVLNCEAFQPVPFEWPKSITWLADKNFCAWSQQQGYQATECGHFGLDAHTNYARTFGDSPSW